MSKYIIELDDDIAKGIRGENDCKVEPREIVRSYQATIADAIANGTPYNEADVWRKSNELLKKRLTYLGNPTGDCISRNAVIRMFNTMDRYKADKLILQDTDKEFPKNEVFIVDECYEQLDLIDNAPPVPQVTVFTENADEKAVADLKAELQSVIESRPQGEQIAWEQGYEAGLAQGKQDRPKGEYIRVDTLWAKCSICGNLTRVIKKYNMPNFCPACGADMRKGDAE